MSELRKKEVLIVLKPDGDSLFHRDLKNVLEWLYKRNSKVFFLSKEEMRLQKLKLVHPYHLLPSVEEAKHFDYIFTVGGDGTLIGLLRSIRGKFPPVVGIHKGTKGFITEFDTKDLLTNQTWPAGKLRSLPLFKSEIFLGKKKVHTAYFINDAVIGKSDISRLFAVFVSANKTPISTVVGDGLIISSPLGSTAYSMSAGGPIIHPEVAALAITPICPHDLTLRPMVVPISTPIEIRVSDKNGPVSITLDGQETMVIGKEHSVKISMHREKVRLVQNPTIDYYKRLREKFYHGEGSLKYADKF